MYEIKGNKVQKKWKIIVWQSHKTKWESSTGKFKNMCGSPHMEEECDIHPEEKKYGSDILQHLL